MGAAEKQFTTKGGKIDGYFHKFHLPFTFQYLDLALSYVDDRTVTVPFERVWNVLENLNHECIGNYWVKTVENCVLPNAENNKMSRFILGYFKMTPNL